MEEFYFNELLFFLEADDLGYMLLLRKFLVFKQTHNIA